MDDGHTAFRDTPRPTRLRIPLSSRARAVHRRRRRAAALGVVALLALVTGVVVGATSSGSTGPASRVAVHPSGYLGAVKTRAGSGPGSLAAVQQVHENAAINRTLGYTPYVRMAGAQHRELALTFDDGPGPYTPRVLSVLQRTHTPAMFFEVGVAERYFSASTAGIVARGYPIGDHTESHPPMSQLSRRRQQSELLLQAAAIGDQSAPFPRMFRPPYGLWNATTLSLLKQDRMLMVLWSVDTNDWQRPGTAAIVAAALRGAKPGAIILMHDAGGDRSQTVAALPRLIRTLRRRGYKLVTVPRLLLDNPAPKQQDITSLQREGG